MSPRRSESPSNPSLEYWTNVPSAFPRSRTTLSSSGPESELQALMEAAPGHDPAEVDPQGPLREAMASVVADLDPLERMVVEALFYEGLTLREAEQRFARSRMTISRLRDAALEAMRDALLNEPAARERLTLEQDE